MPVEPTNPMNQPPDMSYISNNKTGYCVRIVRFGVRRDFSKNYYGEQGALRESLAYRDSLYRQYGIGPRHSDKPNPRIKSRRPNGTLSGVSLSIEGPYAYFVARTHDGVEWCKTRFSIRDFGYVGAYRAAVRFRLKQSGIILDPESVALYRPTEAEYLKLIQRIKDAPRPMIVA